MAKDNKAVKMTPKGRMVYCHIVKPQKSEDGQKDIFSIQLNVTKDKNGAFPKALEEMQNEFAKFATQKFGEGWEHEIDSVFHDGDRERSYKKHDFNKNCICISLRSYDSQPGIGFVNDNGEIEEMPKEKLHEFIYSGAYAVCTYNFYSYEGKKNSGISVGLRTLLFVGHGEKIITRATVKGDFEGITMKQYAGAMAAPSEDDSDDASDV